MPNTYDIGDIPTITGTFTDSATPPVAYDPTTVSLVVEDPAGTEVTYTYGGGGSIGKSGTGVYYQAVTLNTVGIWRYRWIGGGTGATASEFYLLCRASLVGASTAYTTVEAVKTYLAISGGADDVVLYDCVTRAQAYIEAETQRVFSHAATGVARYFTPGRDTDGATLWLDADLCAITSITNGDGATIVASKYTMEPRNVTPWYAIRLLGSSGISWTWLTDPDGAITVTGKWAYSATPPNDIVQATIRLASFYYRQREQKQFATESFPSVGVVVTPGSLPKDVTQTIAKYRRVY